MKFEKKVERLDIVMSGHNATVSFRVFQLTINHQKYREIGIIGSELSKCQKSGAKHAYLCGSAPRG